LPKLWESFYRKLWLGWGHPRARFPYLEIGSTWFLHSIARLPMGCLLCAVPAVLSNRRDHTAPFLSLFSSSWPVAQALSSHREHFSGFWTSKIPHGYTGNISKIPPPQSLLSHLGSGTALVYLGRRKPICLSTCLNSNTVASCHQKGTFED
jgi:hypothetical protein